MAHASWQKVRTKKFFHYLVVSENLVPFAGRLFTQFSFLLQSLALTLESGSFVKFQYNLGTNPINIINWAVRVYPGDWYTVYATRSVS